MDIERFTVKAQDGIDRAFKLAVKSGHRHVVPADEAAHHRFLAGTERVIAPILAECRVKVHGVL